MYGYKLIILIWVIWSVGPFPCIVDCLDQGAYLQQNLIHYVIYMYHYICDFMGVMHDENVYEYIITKHLIMFFNCL